MIFFLSPNIKVSHFSHDFSFPDTLLPYFLSLSISLSPFPIKKERRKTNNNREDKGKQKKCDLKIVKETD
jgi:hypothetical protein